MKGSLYHGESAGAPCGGGCQCTREVVGPSHDQGLELDPYGRGRDLHLLHHQRRSRIGPIPEDGDSGEPGKDLFEELQALSAQLRVMLLRPVTLPPGRARLDTSPAATGSPAVVVTIGIALVAYLAAKGPGVPWDTMTSTLSRTSSAARAGSRSYFPSA